MYRDLGFSLVWSCTSKHLMDANLPMIHDKSAGVPIAIKLVLDKNCTKLS